MIFGRRVLSNTGHYNCTALDGRECFITFHSGMAMRRVSFVESDIDYGEGRRPSAECRQGSRLFNESTSLSCVFRLILIGTNNLKSVEGQLLCNKQSSQTLSRV